MKKQETIAYVDADHGYWVDCKCCGRRMLLPFGAERCPECGCDGTLRWVDSDEVASMKGFGDVRQSERKLEPYEYLMVDKLKELHPEIYQRMVKDGSIRCCKVCGKPMSDGYYCDDQFYCSDECLHKDHTQAELDAMMYQLEDDETLEDLDEDEKEFRFSQQDVCYYTEWESCYNM